eukprot:754697-Alexandrium_andersonii.AAC.1
MSLLRAPCANLSAGSRGSRPSRPWPGASSRRWGSSAVQRRCQQLFGPSGVGQPGIGVRAG